jgi:hypothetical protein
MRREWITDFRDRADDDVEKTGRQSGLFIDPRDEETACHGGIFRRLDNDRISQRQCGANRTVGQVHGEVPWAEHADHPERLAISPTFLLGLIERKNPSFHAMWEGCGYQRHGMHKLPFKLGFDTGAPGFADQPVHDLAVPRLHDRCRA